MQQLDKFMYYYERGGMRCALSVINQRIRNDSFKDNEDIMGKRFYKYFLNLPQSDYLNELKFQLRLFVKNGESYDIDHPQTFNEKIQWLKIYDATPIKTQLADKYQVRDWVASKIGREYLIPLVGGPWSCGEEIDFHALPNQFVLKANHASGRNIIIKDKSQINIQDTVQTVNKWMNTLYGWRGMETHYFFIKRKIIAEKYIEQADGNLLDYKIYCHNGNPLYFQIIGNRSNITHDGRLAFYDTEWRLCDFNTGDYPEYDHIIDRPEKIDELLDVAKSLSKGFYFVRVDLYVIQDRVYFGEMSFTPGNGFLPWKPKDANYSMGRQLFLPIDL